ncbi:MAG: hypothetical protein Q4B50_00205 [Bacillota bacterium]|nr:hypothetical protein [Bacillota bacterium]
MIQFAQESLKALSNWQKEYEGEDKQQQFQKYTEYMTAVADLFSDIDTYFKADQNGIYPRMDEKKVQALRDKYMEINKRTGELIEEIEAGNLFADSENGTKINDLALDFLGLLRRDYRILSSTLQVENKSLAEILAHERSYELDVNDQELSVGGARQSERIPVSYTDQNGDLHQGFFTPAQEDALKGAKKIDALWEKTLKEYPEYADVFNAFRGQQALLYIFLPDNEAKLNKALSDKDTAKEMLKEILTKKYEGQEEELNPLLAKLENNPDLVPALFGFAKEYSNIINQNNVQQYGVQADTKSTCSDALRNAAMTSMADYLGLQNLISRSVPMKLLHNGKEISGVFMEKAVGEDLSQVSSADNLFEAGEAELDNPAAFKSIADLQILDLICGNVDRHPGNMFYQFNEEGKLIGVQGIDNDCSFGKVPISENHGQMQFLGTKDILVISESMAKKVLQLNEDNLDSVLDAFPFSDDEMNAAMGRIEKLQAAIKEGQEYYNQNPEAKLTQGKLKIVKDDEWQNYKLEDLASQKTEEYTSTNYFTTIKNLPNSVSANINKQRTRKEQKEKFPELFPKKSTKEAKGELLEELNAPGIKNTERKLNTLEKQMEEANKGFFIGSKEFDNMMAAFRSTKALSKENNPEMTTGKIESLQKSYQDMLGQIDKYLKKKEKEESELTAKGKTPSDVMKKRMKFASGLKEFVGERLSGLDITMDQINQEKIAIAEKVVLRTFENENIEPTFGASRTAYLELANAPIFKSYISGMSRQELKDTAAKDKGAINTELLTHLNNEKHNEPLIRIKNEPKKQQDLSKNIASI